APWVAITGTNGKSTTTALAGHLFRAAGREAWTAGNIGVALTERAAVVPPKGVIVAEVSSFQLERTVSFRPRVAVLLNLTPDHLDRYPDLDAYAAAKARVFARQGEGDVAAVNADDPAVSDWPERFRIAARVVRFSLAGDHGDGAFIDADGRVVRAWK